MPALCLSPIRGSSLTRIIPGDEDQDVDGSEISPGCSLGGSLCGGARTLFAAAPPVLLPLSETPSAFVPVVLRSVARLVSLPAHRQLFLAEQPSPETRRGQGEQAEFISSLFHEDLAWIPSRHCPPAPHQLEAPIHIQSAPTDYYGATSPRIRLAVNQLPRDAQATPPCSQSVPSHIAPSLAPSIHPSLLALNSIPSADITDRTLTRSVHLFHSPASSINLPTSIRLFDFFGSKKHLSSNSHRRIPLLHSPTTMRDNVRWHRFPSHFQCRANHDADRLITPSLFVVTKLLSFSDRLETGDEEL
ncbi:hypothetical protein SCHPADRAFT_980415 [Schizopora paradoxa]|uniref:Uncharacterized protein n=1 Tax=Schizopora paradoxa TaxID=27342 RepID=A0A0H2RWN0_9AGAM|nr:hypothetical protein SCHPADRAFT_980415 [Schizopora paradoxa]